MFASVVITGLCESSALFTGTDAENLQDALLKDAKVGCFGWRENGKAEIKKRIRDICVIVVRRISQYAFVLSQ